MPDVIFSQKIMHRIEMARDYAVCILYAFSTLDEITLFVPGEKHCANFHTALPTLEVQLPCSTELK